MKRGSRLALIGLGGLLLLVLIVAGILSAVGSWKLNRTYEVETASLIIPTGPDAIARGEHLTRINGCRDCHGPALAGNVFADAPPFRVVASNLTRGVGGVGDLYDARTFDRAIRHGVGDDGKALQIMPSAGYHNLSDEDAANIIAYLQTLPPVNNELPATEFHLMGRLLAAVALDVDMEVRTDPARTNAPPPSASAEYGAYLTSITCSYCHGENLAGAQPPNPDSPPAPDLRTAAGWPYEAFSRALRTGVTPSGRVLDPMVMPWTLTAAMTEDELRSVYAYLGALQPASGTPAAK